MDAERTETPLTERKVVRRGLIAGLAGLGAAAMLKLTGAEKAQAADGDSVVIGATALPGMGAQSETRITANPAFNDIALQVLNGASAYSGLRRVAITGGVGGNDVNSQGVIGFNTGSGDLVFGVLGEADGIPGGYGVMGRARTRVGVEGRAGGDGGIGVRGVQWVNGTGVKGLSNSQASNSAVPADGNGSGIGVHGKSGSGNGVRGESSTGIGIYGVSGTNLTGVKGVSNTGGDLTSDGNGSGIGVHGKSGTGVGVAGTSTSSYGIQGTSGTGIAVAGHINSMSATTAAVEGSSNAPQAKAVQGFGGNNGIGVKGLSNVASDYFSEGNGSGVGVQGKSTGGPGVEGISVNSLGVRGTSTNFVGVVGISTNNHGLYGFSASPSGAALVGDNGGGGLAGIFNGSVQIFGSLQVFGAPKNAVVKMPDGTNASLYCQESPEPYFEDFGRAQLVGGVANVPIEREFATLVAGGDYHVFAHAEGDTNGLYVSRRTPTGFEVRENRGGVSNAAFSYRIVTRRKDVEGRRFARVSDDGAKSVVAARAALGTAGPPPPGAPGGTVRPPVPFVQPPGPPVPTETPRQDGLR